MFREPQQAVLDRWVKGELTELEFLKASKWYETWGFDFGAYRDLLLFAKEHRIDVVALNPPKELQEAIRRTGLDNVPEDLRRNLPEIGETDPWQRAVLRGVFGGHAGHGGGDESFDSFLRVQLLWEETMAQKVVDYLKSPRGEGKRMVTITGGWHVKYGFGLPKKVVRRVPMPYAILLPEEISTPEQQEGRLMRVDLPEVPLLPAHFLWYVPFNGIEEKRVRMGVRMEEKEGRLLVASVATGSPAEVAGIAKGDELLALDGQPVKEPVDVLFRVSEKRDGDTAQVTVRRGGEEKTLAAHVLPDAEAERALRLRGVPRRSEVKRATGVLARRVRGAPPCEVRRRRGTYLGNLGCREGVLLARNPRFKGGAPCRSSSGWSPTRSRSC